MPASLFSHGAGDREATITRANSAGFQPGLITEVKPHARGAEGVAQTGWPPKTTGGPQARGRAVLRASPSDELSRNPLPNPPKWAGKTYVCINSIKDSRSLRTRRYSASRA